MGNLQGHKTHNMAKTIGIDLGTTNSVVAVKDVNVRTVTTGPNNEELCRSCVGFDKKTNEFIVGNTVYRNWKRYAPNIVVSVKRLMGASITDAQVKRMQQDKDMYPYDIAKLDGGTDQSTAIVLGGRQYTPEQLSAEILKSLRRDASVKLNEEVTHAVITVPAYFNEKQKAATRRAAELAGLKVQQLLAEPTAAAISYGCDKMGDDEDKIFVVYDFGGGTFDLSILAATKGIFAECGTGGDRWLGGDDIDRMLTNYVLDQVGQQHGIDLHAVIEELPERKRYGVQGQLKQFVEDAKKQLSTSNSARFIVDDVETEDGDYIEVDITITRQQFEDMIRPMIERTIHLLDELLEAKSYPIDTIDHILLVGGSSCIPLVRQMLSEKYGADKVLCSEKPMLAIAEGAAILSQSLGTVVQCPECGATVDINADVCPKCGASMTMVEAPTTDSNGVAPAATVVKTASHKYFVETRTDADEVKYAQIIDAGEPLPHEKNQIFHTLVENQKIISLRLYNDIEDGGYEMISTGFFTISDNLPAGSELQFSFRLSNDEIMEASVRVPATGRTSKIRLGRGNKDDHCLMTINQLYDEAENDADINADKLADFFSVMQQQIDDINAHTYSPEDNKWQDIEDTLQRALREARSQEENPDFPIVMAKILLNHFQAQMRDADIADIKKLLQETEKANGLARKQKLDELEKEVNRYGLLIDGYFFNIIAHNSDDPQKAQRAAVAYDQFMAAVQSNEGQRARNIVNANVDLFKSDDKNGRPINIRDLGA